MAIFTLVWNLSSIVARIWAGKKIASPFQTKSKTTFLAKLVQLIGFLSFFLSFFNLFLDGVILCSIHALCGTPILSAKNGDR